MVKNLIILALFACCFFLRYYAKQQFMKGKNEGYQECLGCDLSTIYDCFDQSRRCPITQLAEDNQLKGIRQCEYR